MASAPDPGTMAAPHAVARETKKWCLRTVQQSVFEAPAQFRRLREIARLHEMLVRDVVRVQARLKSIYRSRGVTTPGATVYSVTHRQEWLAKLPPASGIRPTNLSITHNSQCQFEAEMYVGEP